MGFIPGQLDGYEVQKKIKNTFDSININVSEKELNEMLNKFWVLDAYNSLVCYPSYLEYFIEYIKSEKRKEFTKSDFLRYVIDRIIPKNKRVAIQNLSLALEMLETNSVKWSLFNELTAQFEIDETEIKSLIEKKLLKFPYNEELKDEIGFFHHSIQEYLAASLFFPGKNILQSLAKLILVKQGKKTSIKQSWYGVLRFLLEEVNTSDIVLDWLLSLANKNPDIIDEGYTTTILRANFAIDDKTKEKIFKMVYKKYQSEQIWLPIWVRDPLASLISKKNLPTLHSDIKLKNSKIDTYHRRGNILMLIEHLLETKNSILTENRKERLFWKDRLIKFANDKNKIGVLQRYALHSLAHFHDEKILNKVKNNFEHSDSLVRQAFIQFCYQSCPNSLITIHYLVEAIKHGENIYGRHGLYEITDKKPLREFLKYLSDDYDFLKNFIDHESIFNNKKKNSDDVLLSLIKKYVDNTVLGYLKKIIEKAFQKEYYFFDNSYFIFELAKIIQTQDKGYIYDLLDQIQQSATDIKDSKHLLYNYEAVLANILLPSDANKVFKKIVEICKGDKRYAESIIYKSRWFKNKNAEAIIDQVKKEKLIEQDESKIVTAPSFLDDRNNKIIKQFKEYLDAGEGKYYLQVFEYFIQNYDVLNNDKLSREISRLKNLVVGSGLDKIDPQKIKLVINKNDRKNFTVSQVFNYYGDILRCAQRLLSPNELSKYRQNIVDFIPLAYSDDLSTILELIPAVNNDDLEYVNRIMNDKNQDYRYLIPSSYLYAIETYFSKKCDVSRALQVIKSFIDDTLISKEDKLEALKLYGKISQGSVTRKFLTNIFKNGIIAQDIATKNLAETANTALIEKFQDSHAIKWRFNEIKKRAVPFNPDTRFGVHTVGPVEEELDNLHFAQPLIKLNDIKFFNQFVDLLRFSSKKLKKEELRSYAQYIWRITASYIDNLKFSHSFLPLLKLEKVLRQLKLLKESHWWNYRLEELEREYNREIGKFKSLSEIYKTIKKLKL